MPLLLGSDQELIQRVVREFAQKELAPDATPMDRDATFRAGHAAKMAPLGLLGLFLPAEEGGSGTDTLSFVVAVEEVARVSGTDAALMILQNAAWGLLLAKAASPQQKQDYLSPTVAGTRLGGVAYTEEAGGTRLRDVLTTAHPDADGYTITGSKAFVALGGHAHAYVVSARVPDAGSTLFLVDADADGVHFSRNESKLGLRALPLVDMYLNRVRVPKQAVVGKPGAALEAMRESRMMSRLGVAAGLVGLTHAAMEQSIDFARNRVQFGQPIIRYGAVRGFLADVQAELEAARATAYGAAALRDAQKDFEEEIYEARLLAHKVAVRGTRIAQKVHGGAGFMRDLPVERVSRDVRTLMHLWDAHDITRGRLATHLFGT